MTAATALSVLIVLAGCCFVAGFLSSGDGPWGQLRARELHVLLLVLLAGDAQRKRLAGILAARQEAHPQLPYLVRLIAMVPQRPERTFLDQIERDDPPRGRPWL